MISLLIYLFVYNNLCSMWIRSLCSTSSRSVNGCRLNVWKRWFHCRSTLASEFNVINFCSMPCESVIGQWRRRICNCNKYTQNKNYYDKFHFIFSWTNLTYFKRKLIYSVRNESFLLAQQSWLWRTIHKFIDSNWEWRDLLIN